MTIDDVKQFYGSYNQAAKALGLTRQAICIWKQMGHVPLKHQFTYQSLSNGKLKANPADTNYWGVQK